MTQVIETARPAAKVVLKADRQQITADGRDVAIITVEIQDQKGRIVPDACKNLNISLVGDGRILGVGNGDPSYLGADHPKTKDCKEFQIPAFNGLAQIILQSGTTPSDMTLAVSADGLKSGNLMIPTK